MLVFVTAAALAFSVDWPVRGQFSQDSFTPLFAFNFNRPGETNSGVVVHASHSGPSFSLQGTAQTFDNRLSLERGRSVAVFPNPPKDQVDSFTLAFVYLGGAVRDRASSVARIDFTNALGAPYSVWRMEAEAHVHDATHDATTVMFRRDSPTTNELLYAFTFTKPSIVLYVAMVKAGGRHRLFLNGRLAGEWDGGGWSLGGAPASPAIVFGEPGVSGGAAIDNVQFFSRAVSLSEAGELLTPPSPRIARMWVWPNQDAHPVISIPDGDVWTRNVLLKATNASGPWIEIPDWRNTTNRNKAFTYVTREEYANCGIHIVDGTESVANGAGAFHRFLVQPFSNLSP